MIRSLPKRSRMTFSTPIASDIPLAIVAVAAIGQTSWTQQEEEKEEKGRRRRDVHRTI